MANVLDEETDDNGYNTADDFSPQDSADTKLTANSFEDRQWAKAAPMMIGKPVPILLPMGDSWIRDARPVMMSDA